jgi:hypothetical protein
MGDLDHNAAGWLRVEYLGKRRGKKGWAFEPGWYVVRTCPCHPGEPVTLSLKSEDAASSALALLLRFGTAEAADG